MNFALILFVLVVITGVAWVAERLYFLPARRRMATASVTQFDREHAKLPNSEEGRDALGKQRDGLRMSVERQPVWLEYTAGLFPVIAVVFLLRSFVAEPFKIPSGSMLPTLLIGDLILVNKYAYGIRLPVLQTKILDVGTPQRGDVMVFRYPRDESFDYIKRVVGLPGDKISYENKHLSINGQPVEMKADGEFYDSERMSFVKQYSETLGKTDHKLLTELEKPSFIQDVDNFPYRDQCTYSGAGVTCTVPAGHYFMMGDNRDNSLDSRYWGFVPDRNIVGKAFFIWMNFSDIKRIGRFQ